MTDTAIALSILVCGVHTRYDSFLPRIQKQLFEQYSSLSPVDQSQVEIIVLTDNKKMMLGEKRNVMVDMAQGDYVQFVDDDDRVAEDFIKTLLDATREGTDVIAFNASVSINGAPPKICRYSKSYRSDRNTSTEYLRIPNHIACVKKELSQRSSFPNIKYGEDQAYAKLLLPHLKTEHRIDRVLYFYDYHDDVTEAQEHVNGRLRRRSAAAVADIIFLSKAKDRRTRAMTQRAINTAIAGANSLPVNVIVIEQQPHVRYENAHTIYHAAPFHYNRFANLGADEGKADWIVVANNDLEFSDSWLHHLLVAEHPLVSPHEPSDDRQKGITSNETGYTNGRHFSGWCFMISREMWSAIGRFDELVSFWCSDDVVIEQARRHGVEPMVVAKSVVKHLGSKTLTTLGRAERDNLTWAQVHAFNMKYGQDKFADNRWYAEWKANHLDEQTS